MTGTASSVRPDGQAAAAQAAQQDLLGDLLDLNDPEPAPAAGGPAAASNNSVQDLLGQYLLSNKRIFNRVVNQLQVECKGKSAQFGSQEVSSKK